jgi:hypothetical protein
VKITPRRLGKRRSAVLKQALSLGQEEKKQRVEAIKEYYDGCFNLLRQRTEDKIFYLETKAVKIRQHIENNPGLTFQKKIHKIFLNNTKHIELIKLEIAKQVNKRDQTMAINSEAMKKITNLYISSLECVEVIGNA